MDVLHRIAEERIRAAIEGGELDHLPGAGRPLAHEDLSYVPEELRLAYKVLRNGGVLPEELVLHQNLTSLRALLNACRDMDERNHLARELNEKTLRYELLMERRGRTGAHRDYDARVYRRLRG